MAGILESFYYLFESDASKLDKGLTESERKAKELGQEVGKTDAAATNLGRSLASSLAGLAGAALATVSLAAMSRAMFEAADQADALAKGAKAANAEIEDFAAWGDIVKKAGGSAEGFGASLRMFNQQLAQVEVTGKSRAAPFLKELGIDLDAAANKGKTAMDFLPQLADAFKGMSTAKALGLGQRLGLDQATIMALQSGSRELSVMIAREKELGAVTKRQGEIAENFNDTLDDTRHAFRSVWLGVSEYVLPPLTWMAEKLTDVAIWLRKNSDFVVGFMLALGAAITMYALPPLFSMAAAAIVAFAPFIGAGLLVAAVATTFALLYDDVMAFKEGGESMIGAVLNRWPLIGDVVNGIVSALESLWDTAGVVGNALAAMWDNPAQAFSDFLNFVLEGIKTLANAIPGLSSVLGAIGIDITPSGERATPGEAGAAPGGSLGEAVKKGQGLLGEAAASPIGAQSSTSITNSRPVTKSTTVQVGKVEVHTQATDAQGISRAIGDSMTTQMRQAASNFDDGVAA